MSKLNFEFEFEPELHTPGDEGQIMRIGPMFKDWPKKEVPGDCPDCGQQCAPECGRHPKGCIYGGFSDQTAYWLIAEDCPLYHGES